MEQVFTWAETLFSAWSVASFFLAIVGALTFVAAVAGCISGITQAAYRFGLALYGKRIAIISDDGDYQDLRDDLADSGLIKERNIEHVSKNHLAKAKDALLVIVVHGYLETEELRQVVAGKNVRCGLITYCPPSKGRISAEEMNLLGKTAFTTICNFRGRLVNDTLLMMLSTSFKKNDLKR